MPDRQKLKYNPYFVRPEFKRKVCRELQLPSGRWSGYELYPISGTDIDVVRDRYGMPTKETLETAGAENVHEWMLWVAARLKYGVNYLNKQKKQFFLPDYKYGVIQEENDKFKEELEKLNTLIEYRVDTLAEILIKQGPEEVKKNYRDHLTFEKSDI